jgi:hypothetical protein
MGAGDLLLINELQITTMLDQLIFIMAVPQQAAPVSVGGQRLAS